MMLTILPIAILLIIIAIIVAIILKGKKLVSIKFTYWLLLVYTVVLALATIAVVFVMSDSQVVTEVSEESMRESRVKLEKQLSTGKVDEIDRKHLLKHSSFDYSRPTINLRMNGAVMPKLLIERKTVNDGAIDAYAYTGGLYINGMDFTDRLTAPTFQLSNDQFEIYPPAYDNGINLSMMKSEFTITQFTGEGSSFFDPIEHQVPIIYLRIPKNLVIEDEQELEYLLQYVKKSS
ncbi:hypothetical protein [Bacillus tuaregi]|uniref:hypothetical protein n=1 Tax=Bacillus tuaregi TaxID=1816695 RepID=UPI0008F9578D|nr:hypothetical protein [Bacillus tuaregi]